MRALLQRESQVFYLAGTFESDEPVVLTPGEHELLRGWRPVLVRSWSPILTRLQPEILGPPQRIQTFHGKLDLYRLEPAEPS